jgi:hypothetical protein
MCPAKEQQPRLRTCLPLEFTVTLAVPAYATLEQAGADYWELSSQPSEQARTSKGI